jgi:hypothetical protein
VIIDLGTKEVLAVLREFGITGNTTNTRDGIWWLNAGKCPQFAKKYPYADSQYLYDFVSRVLRPVTDTGREP